MGSFDSDRNTYARSTVSVYKKSRQREYSRREEDADIGNVAVFCGGYLDDNSKIIIKMLNI